MESKHDFRNVEKVWTLVTKNTREEYQALLLFLLAEFSLVVIRGGRFYKLTKREMVEALENALTGKPVTENVRFLADDIKQLMISAKEMVGFIQKEMDALLEASILAIEDIVEEDEDDATDTLYLS